MDTKGTKKVELEDLKKVSGGSDKVSEDIAKTLYFGRCPKCSGGYLVLRDNNFNIKTYTCNNNSCGATWLNWGDDWYEAQVCRA